MSIDSKINEVLRIAGTQLDEEINLKGANRIAGFYFTESKSWEIFPRTEERVNWNDSEADKYSHNTESSYLEKEKAIRFSIFDCRGTIGCIIESPKLKWIKPFVKELDKKYPEETAMIEQYDLEWYNKDGSSTYKTIKVGEGNDVI